MSDGNERRLKGAISLKNKDMEAWLRLEKPDDGGQYTYAEVQELLDKMGVVYGVNSSRISAMIQKGIYGREVLVASGRPAEEGADGYYEYIFDMETNKKPAIRDDGSVDYASVNVITCVNAGDIIAMYHPAVKGKAGSTVKAKIVPAKPTKELKPLYPVHVTYNAENMIYRADMDGRVELTKTQIKITDVQEYTDDIDNVHGDVVFKGDVIIHGNVAPGVKIIATKSVTIDKAIEMSDIEAGEDVLIRGGILGNGKCRIRAKGNLKADFIEYAEIDVDGDIEANYILDSRVNAKGTITATGKTGMILGGNVYGMMGINTMIAGNDVGVKTIIAAGIRDSVYQAKYAIERQIKAAEEILKSMEAKEEELERSIRLGTASELDEKQKTELVKTKIERKAGLSGLKAQLQEMQEMFERCKDSKIYVEDSAYAGTVVQLDDQQMTIDEEPKRRVEFKKDSEGRLIMRGVTNYA